MNYWYGIIMAVFFSVHSVVLLEKPQRVTQIELSHMVDAWETAFSWRFWKVFNFTCCYQGAQHGAALVLQCCGVPIYSYNFQYIENIKKYFNKKKGNYYFITPLVYTKPSPQVIDVDDLYFLLKGKKVIFYTGAGISAASNVATMDQLEKSLKISKSMKFFKEIFFHPQEITHAFAEFCKSAIYSQPTPAHCALHQLAQNLGGCILTENIDLLQQRAGSLSLFTHGPELRDIQSEDLDDVEIIVCIGLRYDDCGFLSWYKANNPKGILVAVNLEMPNYLAPEDCFVQGDLQKIVPEVAKLLCN